jgi:hypothetical protein
MSGEVRRRVILHMSVSLDGFFAEGRDIPGSVDHGDVRHQANLEMIGQVGLIAIGRGAYEGMARAWATSDSAMASLINALPKVVFSKSLAAVDWANAVLNAGPVQKEIPQAEGRAGWRRRCFRRGALRAQPHPPSPGRRVPAHRPPDRPRCRERADARFARTAALRARQPHRSGAAAP